VAGAAAPIETSSDPLAAFDEAAERFHAALSDYVAAGGRWGFETLANARTAAAYALLALPGDVIRSELKVPASRFMAALLKSSIRQLQRTAAEEAAFIECWRRLGLSWADDAAYRYGLPLIALSRHGFELMSLQPLSQDLGWTERFWLQCMLETLPGFAAFADPAPAEDMLPAPMQLVHRRLAALPAASRVEMARAMDAAATGIVANVRLKIDGSSQQQEEIETLRSHLEAANADRENGHRAIHALSADLKEANADREISHRAIHSLAADLKEANADRAAIHASLQSKS
jgi:hypothetical protein